MVCKCSITCTRTNVHLNKYYNNDKLFPVTTLEVSTTFSCQMTKHEWTDCTITLLINLLKHEDKEFKIGY